MISVPKPITCGCVQPTSAFAPPTLGAGQTLGYRAMNVLAWGFIRKLLTGVYRPLIAAMYKSRGIGALDGGFDVEVRQIIAHLAILDDSPIWSLSKNS